MRLLTNVYQTAPTGGVELNVFQVTRELARRGHAVDLLYVEGGALESEYRSFCRSVRRVKSIDYSFPRHRLRRVMRERVQLAPTSVIAMRARPDVLYANRMASTGWTVPVKALRGTPIVTHLHGCFDYGSDRTRWFDRRVDRFAMVSRFLADQWLEAGLSPDKIEVVHNGVDPLDYPVGGIEERTAARRALAIPDGAFVAAYVGRLDPGKGVETLIDAWNRLGLKGDEGRLLVVGSPVLHEDPEGQLARFQAETSGTGVFLPARRDVVTPLHAADVAVVPSTVAEAFGRSVIEGLATGRPVIGSRIGAIPEILSGPLARFLFEPGDAAELTDLLRGIVGWREAEPDLAGECAAHVAANFTLSKAVDGLERIFNAVL